MIIFTTKVFFSIFTNFYSQRRVKENEIKKKEAKEKGIKVDCKRKVCFLQSCISSKCPPLAIKI